MVITDPERAAAEFHTEGVVLPDGIVLYFPYPIPAGVSKAKWCGRYRVSANLFFHEARKLLVHQGALWVLLGLAVVKYITYAQMEAYISLSEHRYMQYSEGLAGPATADEDAYIAQGEARFAALRRSLTVCGKYSDFCHVKENRKYSNDNSHVFNHFAACFIRACVVIKDKPLD